MRWRRLLYWLLPPLLGLAALVAWLIVRHPLAAPDTPKTPPANEPRAYLLPDHDTDDYDWIDPAPQKGGLHNCAHCHEAIYREWTGSAHSRSASGRHFRNLYEGTDWDGKANVGWSLLGQHPDGAAVCSSCHAPAGPAFSEIHELTGLATKGVHCDYCHKITAASDDNLGKTHGRFNLTLLRPERARDGEEQRQVFFGPLADVERAEDVYSPLYKQSLYCASCHEGIVFGVPVYTTYSEWLASPAKAKGTQCQDCHMKPTGTMTNVAPGAGGKERDPHTLGNHRFVDGSMTEMLRRAVHATAQLDVTGAEVRATVSVVAKGVGHRVPTGYIDRHLVLVVEGLTAVDQLRAPLRGPTLPDLAGEGFTGKGGKLYAKRLQDERGHSPAPFWKADPTPIDTRLSPDERDETTFIFPPDAKSVRVRVLYRRFWPEVIRQKKWPDADVVIVDESFGN